MVCFMDHEGVLVFFSFQVRLIEMTSIQLLPGEQKTQKQTSEVAKIGFVYSFLRQQGRI